MFVDGHHTIFIPNDTCPLFLTPDNSRKEIGTVCASLEGMNGDIYAKMQQDERGLDLPLR